MRAIVLLFTKTCPFLVHNLFLLFIIFNSITLYICYWMLISISYSTYEMRKNIPTMPFSPLPLPEREHFTFQQNCFLTSCCACQRDWYVWGFFARFFSVFDLSLSLFIWRLWFCFLFFVFFVFCLVVFFLIITVDISISDKLISRPPRSKNLVKK